MSDKIEGGADAMNSLDLCEWLETHECLSDMFRVFSSKLIEPTRVDSPACLDCSDKTCLLKIAKDCGEVRRRLQGHELIQVGVKSVHRRRAHGN